MLYLRAFPLIALLAIVLPGCSPAPTGTGSENTDSSPVAEAEGNQPETDTGEVSLVLADRAKYDQVIGQHAGRVVLVDFWATWCLPCVQQFPHTVELAQSYGPDRLAVVTVSMDEPQDRAKVLAFLEQQQAVFDNLISEYGVGQKGFSAFEITDGAVPHYKVYDRSGRLHHAGGSVEEVDQILAQLLAEERM